MDHSSPYAAPEASVELTMGALKDRSKPVEPSARAVFLAWEKLRFFYNAILVIESIIIALGTRTPMFHSTIIDILGAAVIANVYFCAGPCVEGYLNLIGMPRRIARWFIFIPGLLIAAFLVKMGIILVSGGEAVMPVPN